MEILSNSLTDNIIYRANIFNYDINFLTSLKERNLKLDLNIYSKEKKQGNAVDLSGSYSFLQQKSKDQLAQMLELLSLKEEGEGDKLNSVDDLSKKLNDLSVLGDKVKGLRVVPTSGARKTLILLMDIISFSKNHLNKSENKRLDELEKLQVDQIKSSQQVRNSFSDNILYGLLYLDGLVMFNIDIVRLLDRYSPLLGINFHEVLFEIISNQFVEDSTKEIASHILSAYLSFVNPDGVGLNLWKEFITWTYNYYTKKKRENCLTSNISLITTFDPCVDVLYSGLDNGRKIVQELFDFMVKTDSNYNLIYESLFTVWNLSNNKNFLSLFENKNERYLEKIVQVIKTNKIDKIVRIGLMTIKNLLESHVCLEILLDSKFMKSIEILLSNKWNDPVIKEHLNSIYDYLEKNYKFMNSFEKYVKELESGDIKQGSLHSSSFWEENYKEFEKNNFEYIKMLVKILQNPNNLTDRDIEMKCIACFDLGEFVRMYPGGASIIEYFGAKDSLLFLIQHSNLELKNRALVCLQKIMMRSLKK